MSSPIFDTKAWTSVSRPGDSLNIRPSSGARGEEILDSLPFSLPSFPFSPETPDTQASFDRSPTCRAALHAPPGWVCAARDSKLAPRSKKKFP